MQIEIDHGNIYRIQDIEVDDEPPYTLSSIENKVQCRYFSVLVQESSFIQHGVVYRVAQSHQTSQTDIIQ
jgi:hypothetical protein